MLKRLLVQNYALIEQVELDFQSGLTVLTGETGAGKSLLVESIGLILGQRAEGGGPLLYPDRKCVVEAEFAITDTARLTADLTEEELELLPELDSTLIIRREIQPAGKSRAFLNDSPIQLTLLRRIAARLVDLHSQMNAQQLLDAASQTDVLDAFAGITSQVRTFAALLRELRKAQQELNGLRAAEQETLRRQEFLVFQIQELEKANLNIEEEAALEQDLRLLENAGTIGESLQQVRNLLSNETAGALEQVLEAARLLDRLTSLDSTLAPEAERLREVRYTIADIEATLADRQAQVELDPERLVRLTERNDLLSRLKMKFGAKDVSGLLGLLTSYQNELHTLETAGVRIAELEKAVQEGSQKLLESGLAMEAARNQAAAELCQGVMNALPNVGLANATFRIVQTRNVNPNGLLRYEDEQLEPNSRGLSRVEFLLCANPGTPEGTMAQVASGGEISRVMLAIKSALAGRMQLPLLIFDEIDTGISGQTAKQVAGLMRQLAQAHQLIAITHLPQIASAGHQHLYIYKEIADGRTVSRVRNLGEADRIIEIAKMIAGEAPSEATLAGARELLTQSATLPA
jgi:DNA repair protein RecN (Recombination protein N)